MISRLDYIEKPYNSDYMTYNYNENRYVLTVEGANLSNFDILWVMGDRETTNQYLDLVSRALYSVFLKNTDSKLREKKLWLLSHSKHYREIIQQIFLDVVWYNYRSGGLMTLYQSGINMNEMKVIELHIENAMSVIGNNMAQVGGINERTLRTRISLSEEFNDFDELKSELVSKGLYTQDEVDLMASYQDVPRTFDYLVYKNPKGKITLEDFTFWEKEYLLKGVEW